ncbi:hypothetical protein K458DRAFT_6791 [Lentithecium fluviatile CBS 122367]|uniref:Uncharacterized protein n=1 Tax=Lentithecium fluviatile CBS 122367 TaxID=1168545 RepID=A0A6G1JP34_9PLEO|nr:hypothetical protein K458DRAFT_6791 [Lentithecium fluviatile CBS 122367]
MSRVGIWLMTLVWRSVGGVWHHQLFSDADASRPQLTMRHPYLSISLGASVSALVYSTCVRIHTFSQCTGVDDRDLASGLHSPVVSLCTDFWQQDHTIFRHCSSTRLYKPLNRRSATRTGQPLAYAIRRLH